MADRIWRSDAIEGDSSPLASGSRNRASQFSHEPITNENPSYHSDLAVIYGESSQVISWKRVRDDDPGDDRPGIVIALLDRAQADHDGGSAPLSQGGDLSAMDHTPIPSTAHGGSPEALWRIAADPSRVEALHAMVGDFCHLLRNRLNALQMGLYLARKEHESAGGGSWDELDAQYRDTERVIELFQTICRPMALTPLAIDLGLVLQEFTSRWSPRFAERGMSLDLEMVESDGPSHVDPCRLSCGLDAMAHWRIDRGRRGTRAQLRGWVGQGRSRVEWREDVRAQACDDGSLPLAALSRIVSAHGGKMDHDNRDGCRVLLDWPHPSPRK
jgi:hypothetical protein